MKSQNYLLFIILMGLNSFAQKNIEQLKSIQESKSVTEFEKLFFTNTSNFTISAISNNSELRKIEETALLYGIDLKIKELIKSNKIYKVTFEIKTEKDTLVETFSNGIIPLNKIEIEFYKNGNPEANENDKKAKLTILKDRNHTKNGNIPRLLFPQ